mmetsp:Transcript_26971/g.50364  ORF Transcript_26971/g.50364 Transcript_26971/m.50364 type:complete len:98 (+) Transcript_26971:748-1041(+)
MMTSNPIPHPRRKKRTRMTDGWTKRQNRNPNVSFVLGEGGTPQLQNVAISSAGGASYHAVIGKQSVRSVDNLFDDRRWCALNTTHRLQNLGRLGRET